MDIPHNAVLIQSISVAELEAMVERAVERRMESFYARITETSPALVRRKDAARMLGISLPTLTAYARAGFLHAKHVGGRVFFSEDELERLRERR